MTTMSTSQGVDEPLKDASTTKKNVFASLARRKDPPPESPASISTRRLVIASFWLVVLFLGLPTWWFTTMVYRANLPLQQMSDWAEAKICAPIYPLKITLETPSLQRAEAQTLLRSAQNTLDDLNDFSAHHLRLSLPHGIAESDGTDSHRAGHNDAFSAQAALTIRLSQEKDISSPMATLRPHTRTIDISYSANMLPSSPASPSIVGTFMATHLQQMFAEEQALLAKLRDSHLPSTSSRHLSPEVVESMAKRTTRSAKYAPTYHLTFSLFTSTETPSGWDIELGLQETFSPLLKALSSISNFTIDTQVQPYSSLPPSVQPIYDDNAKVWTLTERDLGGFVNAAEWPLSPSIGTGPTINFLLYAAPPSTAPLIIEKSNSNSWLVPQWGGVSIYNSAVKPGSPHPDFLGVDDLRPALLTFSSQLMSLLGVPSTPPQSLPMRLSTLTRVRAASLFFSASSTLGSLARLVSTLPSISIPDSVAENVAATMHHLEAACSDFKAGDFNAALQNGKAAEAHAEKAFFEKSMVGQVYFPDEHKVAVYLPLLGPIAVPLLVAAIREIRPYFQRRRKPKQS